jgi:hypothetical protein
MVIELPIIHTIFSVLDIIYLISSVLVPEKMRNMKMIGNRIINAKGRMIIGLEIFFLLYRFINMKTMAEVINIADHIPKMYLTQSKIGDLVRCPSSRKPKKKKVINKKAHTNSPTFQICRFLYADMTRKSDNHQKMLERITCNPMVSSTPYKKVISTIRTIII